MRRRSGVAFSAANLECVHVEVVCERLRTGGAHDVLTAPHGPIVAQRVANKAKNALLIGEAGASTEHAPILNHSISNRRHNWQLDARGVQTIR